MGENVNIWYGLNEIEVYSEREAADHQLTTPCRYHDMTEAQRSASIMLDRGRGKSKKTRRDIYYQLKTSDNYNDLSVHLDNQLVYLFSKSKKELIFTTNMDYKRYFNLMIKHNANTIVMANDYWLDEYSDITYPTEAMQKPFIVLSKIVFSQKLIDFKIKESALKTHDYRMMKLLKILL